MKTFFQRLLITAVISTTPLLANADKNAVDKVEGSLSVMVLGSGGPVATAKGRASAGYLLFADGKPRILMDVGGGTFQRLAKSGVNIKDLDIVLLSHLHLDHTADLSATFKTIYFHNNIARSSGAIPADEGRTAAINIYGPKETSYKGDNGTVYPNGTVIYPSTVDYAHDHYSVGPTPANPTAKPGTERYLTAFVNAISDDDGPMGAGTNVSQFAYKAHGLETDWKNIHTRTVIYSEGGLTISYIPVMHGPVPAVAYRIDYKGHSIVYSGDTSSISPNMQIISNNADLLIYDTAITDTLPANPLFHILHTSPTRMGQVATAANVGTLVLSHLTPVTDPRIKEIKSAVRAQGFTGKIKAAKDLQVYNLGDKHKHKHKHKNKHDD